MINFYLFTHTSTPLFLTWINCTPLRNTMKGPEIVGINKKQPLPGLPLPEPGKNERTEDNESEVS